MKKKNLLEKNIPVALMALESSNQRASKIKFHLLTMKIKYSGLVLILFFQKILKQEIHHHIISKIH